MKKYILVILWNDVYKVNYTENKMISEIQKLSFKINYNYKFNYYKVIR
jgi:hypothetical protein